MDILTSYLPQHEGILPKWMLILSVIALGNSFQAYTNLWATQRLYAGRPSDPVNPLYKPDKSAAAKPVPPHLDVSRSTVTPLSARTFGTWTCIQSIVRVYAAYNIDNPAFYQLAIWTYAVAWVHFMSEWLVYKTARWGVPVAGPAILSTISLVWMITQWDFYVK